MPAPVHRVREVKKQGLSGDDISIDAPNDRNSILETVALEFQGGSGPPSTPSIIYKDDEDIEFAVAIASDRLSPGGPGGDPTFTWAVGGAERSEGPNVSNLLPLITLSPGFSLEVRNVGASYTVNLRATFLV